MQTKYKVGLLRGNLLIASVLLALLASATTTLTDALLLWLAATWLAVTALLLAFNHRRPAMVPWQLLPGLLLAALLWVAPERHITWLWAWAVLLMLPQPRWILLLEALLALATWWPLREQLGLEQWVLAGLLLAALMLLGLSRALDLRALRQSTLRRARLVPGLSLWPGDRLAHDLALERSRGHHEGVHTELLLLQTSRHRCWSLAQRLCRLTHSFEPCYRLDSQTLAVILLSRNRREAKERREMLCLHLEARGPVRAIALADLVSLEDERQTLARQTTALEVIGEAANA
ncbi:hypothetical protein [Halomonas daqiaonensis]|uniref:GGDEF domain-containing protein, diguanylate cyclase (C-di-GMP synthetase) or its enzymatically inactive variants n=1 Tax=Halomonas daqiaonensis TaxID=650850 RepID=A0A1H7KIF0_9GAMM|nr:hypothetical protein [Halomonas daqiaonensis]SEK86304.1 hypothetical protein SAMN04488129_10511 [Halomonas daqiaonensis]